MFRAQRDKVNKKNIYIPKKTIFEKKNDIGIVRRPKNIMKLARLWYVRYMLIYSIIYEYRSILGFHPNSSRIVLSPTILIIFLLL